MRVPYLADLNERNELFKRQIYNNLTTIFTYEMKVLILEDEQPAAERMAELLQLYDKSIEITAVFDSVKDVVLWL